MNRSYPENLSVFPNALPTATIDHSVSPNAFMTSTGPVYFQSKFSSVTYAQTLTRQATLFFFIKTKSQLKS